jgi:hypothetical protein
MTDPRARFWHLCYDKGAASGYSVYPGAEEAIKDACRRLDDGYEITSIGLGHPAGADNGECLAALHDYWQKIRSMREP